MAVQYNQEFNTETFRAASIFNQFAAVMVDASSNFSCIPASGGAIGQCVVIGLAKATAASVGISADIQTGGWGKALAAASLGRGAFVGVGVGTTSLVPLAALGAASAVAAAGQPQYCVGQALEAAGAGAIFTVRIAVRQVV